MGVPTTLGEFSTEEDGDPCELAGDEESFHPPREVLALPCAWMGGDLGDLLPAAPGDPVPVDPRLSLPDDRERKLANDVKLRDGGTLAPAAAAAPEEDDDK